jgi:DNA-binding XRE family transcriptional regulator
MKQWKIVTVRHHEAFSIRVGWEDGRESVVDLEKHIRAFKILAPLRDFGEFRRVSVGEWGWFLAWPCGAEVSGDTLRRLALEQAENIMTPNMFRHWRQELGASLTQAASVLGLSRRMVAYYESGEKEIPKYIALACVGVEQF